MVRIQSLKLFAFSAIAVAASAAIAQAGPLPVKVLDKMYARTAAKMAVAQARIEDLSNDIQKLDNEFADRMAGGSLRDIDAYYEALGEYFDQSASLEADLNAEQSRLSRLSDHMDFIKIQYPANCAGGGVSALKLAPGSQDLSSAAKKTTPVKAVAVDDLRPLPTGIGDDNGIHPVDTPPVSDDAVDRVPAIADPNQAID